MKWLLEFVRSGAPVAWATCSALCVLLGVALILLFREAASELRRFLTSPAACGPDRRGPFALAAKVALAACLAAAVYFGGAKPSGGSGAGGDGNPAPSQLRPSRTQAAPGAMSVHDGAWPDVYLPPLASAVEYVPNVPLSPLAVDMPAGTDLGAFACPTNLPPPASLRAFAISPVRNGVLLGIDWPVSGGPSDGIVGVFGNWRCEAANFIRVADVDVSAATSNAVALIDWGAAVTNAMAHGVFPPEAADPSAGFFRLVPSPDADSDGDGLPDGVERCVTHTDPKLPDTDGDGDPDGWEVAHGFDPLSRDPGIPCATQGSPGPAFALTVATPFGLKDVASSLPVSTPVRLLGAGAEDAEPPPFPDVVLEDGLPCIARDTSHAPHTYVFGYTYSATYTPNRTGDYVFSVAADDGAVFSVGGASASVSWSENHGQAEEFTAHLVAGVPAAVAVSYENSGGGAYFLTCAGPFGGPYSPGIAVRPHSVVFCISPGVNLDYLAPHVEVIGELDPTKAYSVGVSVEDGLTAEAGDVPVSPGSSAVDVKAYPVDNGRWKHGKSATATYVLLEDGEEVARDECVFTCEAPKPPPDCGCESCGEGTRCANGCVEFSQSFGRTPGVAGIPAGRAVVLEHAPSPSLWTPAALRYDHPMMRRVVTRRNLDAVVVDGLGRASEYRRGRPAGSSAGAGGQFYRNGNGDFVEELPDGLRVIYGADGRAAALQPEFGLPVPVAELGVCVETNALGWIAAVESAADGRLEASATGPNAWRLDWTSPTGAAVKSFAFGGDGAGAFTLRETRGAAFAFDYLWTFDPATGGWTFLRDPGGADEIREGKSLAYDETNRVWRSVRVLGDAAGGCCEALATVLDRDGHAARETERRDAATGRVLASAALGEDGSVASETDELGAVTSYARDAFGRVTAETLSADGVPTRTVALAYPAETGGYADPRPGLRVESADGVTLLEEAFARGPRAAARTRTAGGVTRLSREEHDGRGRETLRVREDGRATRTAYSEAASDGSWTETADEGILDETGAFALVPGRSTREVRALDGRGDAVRIERLALDADGAWRPVSWETHAYGATHRVVASRYSDGTSDAADWICAGPVFRTGRDGVTVTNSYNGAKQLAASTRRGAFGEVTTAYGYDAAGRVVSETTTAPGCAPGVVTRAYDGRGRVVSETDAGGRTTLTAYSDDGLVTATTFADGGTRVVTRNADGSLCSVTGTAVTPEYHFHSATNLAAADGTPRGCRVEEVRYGRPDSPRFARTFTDGFGDVVREERSGANGATLVTESEYDRRGRLVRRSETGRPETRYAYDDWGELTNRAEFADGAWRSVSTVGANATLGDGEMWAVAETVLACSDASVAPLVTTRRTRLSGLSLATNAVTVATDARGNDTVTVAAIDPATQSSYETTMAPGILNFATNWYTDGVMVSNITHSGVVTQIRRDALRRETSRIDGRGNATRTEYDALGRVAATVDALTNATAYAYDPMGRVAAVTNALGDATVYEYDARGNRTYEGGATYPVRCTYDVYGNKTTMTTYRHEPEGGGRGATALPNTGDTTTWLYDEASGVMTNKLYADGKGPRYTYTDDGKLATRTWARGVVTAYAYDGWGNLTNTAYSDDTPTVTITYDAMGRQREAHDAAGVTTFAYDAFGANTNETVIGVAGTNTIERFADTYGRNAGYALNGVRQTILGYDEQTGRLATMTTGEGRAPARTQETFMWSYVEGTDLKSQLAYPNGLTASWTYDANNQLLQVQNAYPSDGLGRDGSPLPSANVISQYDYAYDAAGRRIACARSGDAMTCADTIAYAYNARGELTNAVSNVDADYSYSYQYDDIGNRIASCERGTNTTYEANELNQYTSITSQTSQTSQTPQTTLPEFDDDGNQTLIRTATGEWLVTYNGENRPVLWESIEQSQQSTNQTILSMSYDRMGRRVTKNDERFIYDGYLQIANHHSTPTTSNYNSFTWDPTEPVATRPLAWSNSSFIIPNSSFYYAHDGNKNVSEVVAADSALAAHYGYAPFGVVISHRGDSATANPWRFSCEYADDELGCDYWNFRHYEPVMGRWLQRDPIEEDFGGENCYAFIENNSPVKFDCLGLRVRNVNGVIMCRTNRPASGYKPSSNGCGSGWNTYLVPDADYSMIGMVFKVDFNNACNKHDECYGTCAENRNKCDRDLRADMKSECDKIPTMFFTARSRCKLMADVFYLAVDNLGDGPFEDAQDSACAWECCGFVGCGWQEVINSLNF